MIFVTVGTQFPFDRLIQAMDNLLDAEDLGDEVFAQIGDTSFQPRNFEAVASLDKKAYDKCFRSAVAVVSHAGMGTIAMALDLRKPLLVMPRQTKHAEVVNDHQAELAVRFQVLGHILLAEDELQLAERMRQLRGFTPRPRESNPAAVARGINHYLEQLCEMKAVRRVGS